MYPQNTIEIFFRRIDRNSERLSPNPPSLELTGNDSLLTTSQYRKTGTSPAGLHPPLRSAYETRQLRCYPSTAATVRGKIERGGSGGGGKIKIVGSCPSDELHLWLNSDIISSLPQFISPPTRFFFHEERVKFDAAVGCVANRSLEIAPVETLITPSAVKAHSV